MLFQVILCVHLNMTALINLTWSAAWKFVDLFKVFCITSEKCHKCQQTFRGPRCNLKT